MNNGTVHNVMYTSIVCHVCLWYWPHTVTGEWHVFFVIYNLAICDSIILQQLQSTSVLPVLQHLIQWTSDCLFRQIESRLIQLIIIDNNMFTIPIITWAVSEKKFDPSLLVRSLFYLRTSRSIILLQGIYHFCSSEDRCCCSIYHVTAGVRDVMLNMLHDNVDMQNTLTHAVWQNYSLTKQSQTSVALTRVTHVTWFRVYQRVIQKPGKLIWWYILCPFIFWLVKTFPI